MSIEKIDKVKKIKKAFKPAPTEIVDNQDQARVAPNKDKFDKLVSHKPEKVTATDKIEPTTKASLMDEIRDLNHKVNQASKISPDKLVAQADDLVDHIDLLKDKLSTPDLQLKKSVQHQLQGKLEHIDENLRIALSKAGVEYKSPEDKSLASINPIERFLGFLTHGQEQLKTLSNEVELMHLNKKEITPANMLRIQIKMGYISQEIDFFTATLNQALQATKTIMNVQV